MFRGRPPVPTRLKVLNGNPGKRPLPEAEPEPDVVLPAAPKELPHEAQEEWERIVAELYKSRLITNLDLTALFAYCQAWALYLEAREKLIDPNTGELVLIIKTPNGYPVQHPSLSIMNKQVEIMTRIGSQFGMSPVARVHLQGHTQGDLFDGFDDFVGNKPAA